MFRTPNDMPQNSEVSQKPSGEVIKEKNGNIGKTLLLLISQSLLLGHMQIVRKA